MKLTATIKLLPTDEQRHYLYQTLERANAACNWMSEQAWQTKTFNTTRLHHLTYKIARSQFDLGVKNIAVDSDGHSHSARRLLNVRHRHRRLRKQLQQKGTPSAKRLLKHLSGKEHRFASDVNHCISKQLVKIAKGTQRGIALENLEGIRDRVNVPRKRRDELHSWSFQQLRMFVSYKAKRAGVVVVYVDPRNTSWTCPLCACVDKRNRLTQAKFSCISCGFVSQADYVAAINIGRRGAVNHPNVNARPEKSGQAIYKLSTFSR